MTKSSDPSNIPPVTGQALRDQAQYWVARLVAGDVSENELDRLEAWLAADERHARAFSRERALWQDLHAVSDALAGRKDAPDNLLPLRPRSSVRRHMIRAVPIALAASLAAIVALPSLVLDLRADHRTAVGQVSRLTLPDGTIAMLDSDSAVAVDFTDDRRVVHLLAGRAWFQVRHEGRPFSVEAMNGITRDIGTAFEVRRERGTVEVGVTQGSVQVRAPDGAQGRPMRIGERIRYSASGLAPLPGLPASQLATWRSGEILFEKQSVQAAIDEIARYRRASVWMLGDFSKVAPVSGLFLIERPEEAIQMLARMRELRVTRLPGGYLIIRPAATS